MRKVFGVSNEAVQKVGCTASKCGHRLPKWFWLPVLNISNVDCGIWEPADFFLSNSYDAACMTIVFSHKKLIEYILPLFYFC